MIIINEQGRQEGYTRPHKPVLLPDPSPIKNLVSEIENSYGAVSRKE